MKPPALELLPGTRLASTYFLPRCDLPRDGPHGPLHPGQIFLAYSRFSHLLKRNKTWDTSVFLQRLTDELDRETIPVFIDEPDHFRRFGSSSDAKKAEAAFKSSLVSRSS